MAVIPVGYAQINWRFTGASLANPAECVMGIITTEYASDLPHLAEDMYTLFSDTLLHALCNTTMLESCTVKEGPNDLGPMAVFSGTDVGGQASAGASSAVSMLVHKVTAAGGRANRGRMYLPGACETNVNPNGALTPTFFSTFEGYVASFKAAFDDYLVTPYVLHGPGSPVATPTQIVDFRADPTVATQRRRQRR